MFSILWLEVHEPWCLFQVQIVNNGSSCISPWISDQSSAIHSDSLHPDNNWNNWTARSDNYDRSTWPARQKVDWSTLQSVQTLSVDRPLFWALVPCNQLRPIPNPTTYGRQTKEQSCSLTAPSGPLFQTRAPGWLENFSFLTGSNCYARRPEI